MTHIAIHELNQDGEVADWGDQVTDAEYAEAPSDAEPLPGPRAPRPALQTSGGPRAHPRDRVEDSGLEPLTFALPARRSPS